MAGLRAAFVTGLSGLHTSQAALATIGHNIANASTVGYSRQRAEVAQRDPIRFSRIGYLGQGADVNNITRADDRFLELQVMRDRTLSGFYNGREETLAIFERLYAEGQTPTVGDALDGFFDAARELQQDPSSFGARGAFLAAVEGVARGFRTLAHDATVVRHGIDDDLSMQLDEVNRLARKIAEMNARVVSGEVGGEQMNDFRDQRDLAIRELSTLVDVNVLPQANGSVSVEIAGHYNLVQEDFAARLEGVPNPANDGLFDVELVGATGGRTDITAALDEGLLGGLIDVRDRVIAGQLAQLDQLAFEFAEAVNAVHRAGAGLDGVVGRDLFVPPGGVADAAANLRVDPAIAADQNLIAAATDPLGVPGDNRNLQALADLQHLDVAALGDVSFNRFYGELLYEVGTEAAGNRDRAVFHAVRAQQSESLRESVEGVSIDDEMIELTRYQKHFEANSKVITTVERLLDTLMQIIQ